MIVAEYFGLQWPYLNVDRIMSLTLFPGSFLESVKCPNRPGLKDVNIWTENGADFDRGNFLQL